MIRTTKPLEIVQHNLDGKSVPHTIPAGTVVHDLKEPTTHHFTALVPSLGRRVQFKVTDIDSFEEYEDGLS